MRIWAIAVAVSCLVACGSSTHHLPDGDGGVSGAHIVVAPDNAMLTVTDNVPATQAYTATLVDADGNSSDVTAQVTWTLADAAYGSVSGPTLTATGGGAGPSQITAQLATASGAATFTVYVHGHRVEGTLPTDGSLPGLFGSATEDPSRAPALVYPNDNILVPPNLGQFDVHWTDATGNDVWEVKMANAYIDLRIYTQGLDASAAIYTLFNPAEWYPIASTKTQLSLSVAGLQLAAPTTKGTAAAQHVDVTNENAKGGIYYWSTTTQGILRYDISTPDVPPAPLYTTNAPSACIGCHTLSRDGSKIAMTLDDPDGRGTVINIADLSQAIFYDGTVPTVSWDFATFNPDATKLLTLLEGTMQLRDVAGGAALGAALPNTAGLIADHPEISPDGTRLVNVEQTGGEQFQDLFAQSGQIVIRSFDDATNTFGPATVLVPADAANSVANFYPSFSPDGQWIAFTRTTGQGYSDASAETWVIKADGSAPPVQMTAANALAGGALTNSWARWVPFAQTFGAANESLFYLTFSSERPFGVRIPSGGRPQIWMTPFFPDRATAGTDPSGPAFRVPFQDVRTNNHIAQWTQQLVTIE